MVGKEKRKIALGMRMIFSQTLQEEAMTNKQLREWAISWLDPQACPPGGTKLARAVLRLLKKVGGKCGLIYSNGGCCDSYCGKSLFMEPQQDIKYCPFCGKRIKEVKEG